MFKITTPRFVQPLVLSVLLTLSLSACTTASKTASDAPSSTDSNGTTPNSTSANDNKGDAQSDIRKKQIESDIRAREQRNAIAGDPQKRDPEDLASEVRGKLEANIPNSNLTVTAKEAAVTISGTVASKEQLAKIKPLALQIKGVKDATVNAVVKP
jgi:hyperosmotically inducible periplasmic protein